MPSFHEDVLARFDAEGLDAIESHLASCPPCRHELAARVGDDVESRPIPRELVESAKRMADAPVSPRRSGLRVWVAAAAAIGAVAIGVALMDSRNEGPADVLRRGAPQDAAIELHSPVEGAGVPRSRVELRWSPVAGAQRYTVRILDARGAILEERTTETAGVEIREPGLQAGTLYYWYVLATTKEGRVVESRPRSFRIE